MSQFNYTSTLQEFIQGMIQEKQSLGYKYSGSARLLYTFDQFCVEANLEEPVITKEIAQAWIQKKPNEAIATLRGRVCVVRQLSLYIDRLGLNTYILPKNIIPKGVAYVPYIFSNEQLAALFTKIDACQYCGEVPLRHKVLPLLFRLLYGCGLRVSEALNLKIQDVDVDAGILTIIDGKFGKDRLVPLSAQMTRQCYRYAKEVHMFSSDNDYFFPAPDAKAITKGNIYKNFRRFLWQAKISHGGWGKGPRLQDFRHTFSVHCLRKWVFQGKDLAAYLPILKAYLGHGSFRDTAGYLRLTAELYPDITAKMEQAFGHVIPALEGDDHETH
jgi:integrase